MGTSFGSSNQNAFSGTTYTRQELADFIKESAGNALSYAIMRNPTKVYEYIRLNYTSQEFRNINVGLVKSTPVMNSMHDFLLSKYNQLPIGKARGLFIAEILHSLPATAEMQNWTTPKD